MTELSTSRVSTSKDFSAAVELTHIRGIGTSRKRRLASLGIHTVSDLARATATDLIQQVKDRGYNIAPVEIVEWIAQAQRLLIALPGAADELPKMQASDRPGGVSEPILEPMIDSPAVAWSPFASFVIEFQNRTIDGQTEQQTVIRHLETDTVEVWPGVTTEPLQPWVNARLQSQLRQDAQPIGTPITVDIGQLRLVRSRWAGIPMTVDATRRLFPEAINASEPFTLEIAMQLLGLAEAVMPRQQIIYRAQCYARHLETGRIVALGDTVANVPMCDQSSYTALLSDLVLPESGSYRLQVVITIQNVAATPGCFKVPLLYVV